MLVTASHQQHANTSSSLKPASSCKAHRTCDPLNRCPPSTDFQPLGNVRPSYPRNATNSKTHDLLRIDVSTRLRRAIHLKDLVLVKRIIQNNPQSLQNPDFSDNGNTSLHLAAQLGLLEIAVRIFPSRFYPFSSSVPIRCGSEQVPSLAANLI